MEKQHINPFIVRQKAESKEGKEFTKELVALNWSLQEHQFEGYKKQLAYNLKTLEYKKFLGYDVKNEEIEEIKKELKQYENIKKELKSYETI